MATIVMTIPRTMEATTTKIVLISINEYDSHNGYDNYNG